MAQDLKGRAGRSEFHASLGYVVRLASQTKTKTKNHTNQITSPFLENNQRAAEWTHSNNEKHKRKQDYFLMLN